MANAIAGTAAPVSLPVSHLTISYNLLHAGAAPPYHDVCSLMPHMGSRKEPSGQTWPANRGPTAQGLQKVRRNHLTYYKRYLSPNV
jgi:hypothetical protein